MNSPKISLQNTFTHMNTIRLISWFTAALSLVPSLGQAQPTLIAVDSLTESRAGGNADLSGLTYSLKNQAPRTCWAAWVRPSLTTPAVSSCYCRIAVRMRSPSTRRSTTLSAMSTGFIRIRTSFLYSALRMKICLAMSRPRMGCRSGTRRSRQLALRIRFDDEETHHRIGG